MSLRFLIVQMWESPLNVSRKDITMDADQLLSGTDLDYLLPISTGSNVDDNGDGTYHVTLYTDDGGHISTEVDENGNTWDTHITLYAYDPDTGERLDTNEDGMFDVE